jgi:hypothetical protein
VPMSALSIAPSIASFDRNLRNHSSPPSIPWHSPQPGSCAWAEVSWIHFDTPRK